MDNTREFSLADEVWHRVVQIVQEAMLTGVDCADLLRQVRVQESDAGTLVLTPQYRQMIKEHHQKLEKEIEEQRALRESSRIIGNG